MTMSCIDILSPLTGRSLPGVLIGDINEVTLAAQSKTAATSKSMGRVKETLILSD